MTYTNKVLQHPASVAVAKHTQTANLIVHGQGVVIFNASEPCALTFCDVSGSPGLRVRFTGDGVRVHMEPSGEPLVDQRNSRGLVQQRGAYYWFSLDSQNQRLYAGMGEARLENVLYAFDFTKDSTQEKENVKLFFESLVTVTADTLQITSILRDPITGSVPLLVKNTDDLTMEAIASGKYMPKANLSVMSQKLYDCISGKKFVLNTPDFPDFAKAIEYSIATPGMWCHERLKAKATEFNKDTPNYKETYLRITLGENNGESPGIPYVMEIWPVGHYSPVHNHGGSSAVIRVLHGAINVSLFPFLSGDDLLPFAKADFKKGDVTWISPTLNQIHQLKNLDGNKDTCITIQCYMYESDNVAHYDYFDYLDTNGDEQKFDPDSDMEFIAFKNTVKKEWQMRPRCCPW